MPSWKKVVISGSDASLASVFTTSHITGSANISSSLSSTGSFGRLDATSLTGDGSALTGINAGIFSQTGSYYSAPSDLQITGSLNVRGTISGSFQGISTGQKYKHTQTVAATTWTVSHNFDYQYPNIDVYDGNDQIVIPTSITATDSNTITLIFGSPVSGIVIISTGGQAVSERGKNFTHIQSTSSENWRVTHSLGDQYPSVTVYDSDDNVIIPEQIKATDGSKMDITFSEAVSGNANVSIGGGVPFGALSGSTQIASNISGSFGTASGSFSTRVTVMEASSSEVSLTTDKTGSWDTHLTSDGTDHTYINQDLRTTSSPTFATVDTGQGANELYDMNQNVKTDSAVTFATVDTGQGANELYDMDQNVLTTSSPTFVDLTATGTVTAQEFHTEFVSASIVYQSGSTKFGDSIDDRHEFSGSQYVSGSVTATSFDGMFSGALSSSAQIASDVSGSWTTDRLTTGTVSGSAQIASDISGSLGANAALIRTLTAVGISGSFTSVSSSLASRLTAEEGEAEGSVVSSSAQIASDISGSLGTNAALIRSLTAVGITGSFTATSSSLSTRVTTNEGKATKGFTIAMSVAL